MQDTSMIEAKRMGKCPTCGKAVVIRNVKDKNPQYCDRKCATNAKFMVRYKGTMSGPLDRPVSNLSKLKFVS